MQNIMIPAFLPAWRKLDELKVFLPTRNTLVSYDSDTTNTYIQKTVEQKILRPGLSPFAARLIGQILFMQIIVIRAT